MSFAYMQMRPSAAAQKPPLLGAPAQPLGLLSSVYSALEDRETGLSEHPTRLTRTQSHPNTAALEEQRA